MSYRSRLAAGAAVALLFWPIPARAEGEFRDSVSAAAVAELTGRFGAAAGPRIERWRKTLHELKQAAPGGASRTAPELLDAVNSYLNRNMAFIDDLRHWGAEDYWASPLEFVGSGGGDCEDFALAKYYALKELGVPISRLRITYVRSTRIDRPHMVLAYHGTGGADPLILDNIEPRLLPASERPDLLPVFGFNDDAYWLAGGGTARRAGDSSQIRLWRGFQDKLRREQALHARESAP